MMSRDNKLFNRYVMPAIESNMYICVEGDEALIIDPHLNRKAYGLLKRNKVNKVMVLLTHEHYDHISGVNWVRSKFPDTTVTCSAEAGKSIQDPQKNFARFHELLIGDKSYLKKLFGKKYCNSDYTCHADNIISEDIDIEWKGHNISLVLSKGHSDGGMLIYFDDCVITGDNLVNGYGVVVRLPGGNWKTYSKETLPKMNAIADDTWILPGHGKPGYMRDMRQYLVRYSKK